MFLGGAFSQLPVIEYARQKDLYIITVDYLPGNPGHKIADEYYNISSVDKERVLALAQQRHIDAISAYASDPAAPTAAYVSEKMGLVGSTFESVSILSDKGCFRNFLRDNNFLCPWYIVGNKVADLLDNYQGGKAVLKPVDSSGSKGVKIIENISDITAYFDYSKMYSREGKVILEQFIESKGPQLHGEGFVHNGEVVFLCLGDQVFSKINSMAPFSTLAPGVFHQDIIHQANKLVEEIILRCGFRTGGINIEIIRDKDDNLFVLEIGARNGGNFMPQLMKHATGFDIPKANVDSLLNETISRAYYLSDKFYYAQIILHSRIDGLFEGLTIPSELRSKVIEEHLYYKSGDFIKSYNNSRDVVGVLIIELRDEMDLNIYRESLKNWKWVLTG